MARSQITGKRKLLAQNVSHSNIKTKRRFLPNLVNVTFISEALGRNVRLRVSTNAVKSVDHNGGLDAYMLKAKADTLSPRALELKRAIQKLIQDPLALKLISGEFAEGDTVLVDAAPQGGELTFTKLLPVAA